MGLFCPSYNLRRAIKLKGVPSLVAALQQWPLGGGTPLKNTHYQGSYRFLSLDRESLNIKIDLCGAAIAAPYTVICALMPFSDDLGGGAKIPKSFWKVMFFGSLPYLHAQSYSPHRVEAPSKRRILQPTNKEQTLVQASVIKRQKNPGRFRIRPSGNSAVNTPQDYREASRMLTA